MRPAATLCTIAMLTAWIATPAHAAQVTNLTALVQNGQTFLTWTCPPGTGYIYRVYLLVGATIKTATDLSRARYIAAVADSSWYDRRLSTVTGSVYGYVIKSGTEPLGPDKGVCVVTAPTSAWVAYAVTVQTGLQEDRTIVPGENALKRMLVEVVRKPVPIYQRTIPWSGVQANLYTLWTTDTPTPLFPAMANTPGVAFDCAIVPPVTPGNGVSSLAVLPHRKSGNLLECLIGTGLPGEWVLALDDPVPNQDANTFWYGYHEGYDTGSDVNYPPIDGVVRDYTLRRILHTLDWARSSFGIDTTRVYAYGGSMGGIGSLILAFNKPEWIAAILTNVAKFDFSFVSDPNPLSSFNAGNPLRGLADKLWGEVGTNLPSSQGLPIYQALNDGALAGTMDPVSIPPIFCFNGKWDTTVGWAEKIPFYAAMRRARQAGFFFWDQRDHIGTPTSAWGSGDPRYLYRFRTDLSFPVFTNCSIDNDPGNGDPANGDSVGTINGFLECDTDLTDENVRWGATLRLRDLTQHGLQVPAPDSVLVDVTPRRLQKFVVVEGITFRYTVTRLSDGAVVQDGFITQGNGNVLTITGVKVYRGGSRLLIEAQGTLGVPSTPAQPRLQLHLSRNPVVPGSVVELSWPFAGDAKVELLDVSGRRVRTVFHAAVRPGTARIPFPTAGLPSGVYVVAAWLDGHCATSRAIFMH